MALPTVQTIQEISEFSKTVSPFLHQLSPSHVLPLLRGEIAPKEWYLSTNPLMTAILFALTLSVLTFISAEINRNYSQVDRLWSMLPALYIAHFTTFAHMKELDTQRLDTLATLSTLWGARLTFNFWRKGGYKMGEEDYRWAILRKHITPAQFVIFDLVFIAFWQNILLLLIATPAYLLLQLSTVPGASSWDRTDIIFSRLLVALLALETLADQQQWSYQKAKRIYKETAQPPTGYTPSDLDRGFVVTGLWSWSRHPNFACEQAIWVALYQWSCFATDTLYNWSGVGALGYLALFQGSTIFTESITAGKYPEYKEYQKLVSKFVPGLSAFSVSGMNSAVLGSEEKKDE